MLIVTELCIVQILKIWNNNKIITSELDSSFLYQINSYATLFIVMRPYFGYGPVGVRNERVTPLYSLAVIGQNSVA